MRKMCMLIILMMSMALYSCNDDTISDSPKENVTNKAEVEDNNKSPDKKADDKGSNNYTISQLVYNDSNIKINYPKINNFKIPIYEDKINDLIKSEMLKFLEDYKENINKLSLELDYEITYQGDSYLSIKYLGLAIVEDTPYPTNVIYTTNIDLEQEKIINLKDLFSIDEKFISKFKKGKYIPYDESLNIQESGILEDTLSIENNDMLKEEFSKENSKFYLTENSIVVSHQVAHALGDHLEMEIDYSIE